MDEGPQMPEIDSPRPRCRPGFFYFSSMFFSGFVPGAQGASSRLSLVGKFISNAPRQVSSSATLAMGWNRASGSHGRTDGCKLRKCARSATCTLPNVWPKWPALTFNGYHGYHCGSMFPPTRGVFRGWTLGDGVLGSAGLPTPWGGGGGVRLSGCRRWGFPLFLAYFLVLGTESKIHPKN